MRSILASLSLIILPSFLLNGQTIKVQPYLQDASPHQITIMWETDTGEESIVEWGVSEMLGNTTMGTAIASVGEARIHEVTLVGLEDFTKYHYRVKTGAAISATYHFKTPPHATAEASFRIVAMSDMQRDNALPDKFQEVVEEGIIDYLSEEVGGDLVDNLALVLIPGDLVQNGNNYSSWESTFFDPGQALFSRVPIYPVPGNHENNAVYFFQYFKMPENGTTGFAEHWWHKDYGNVRIIGLDSNNPFSNQEQLNWLDQVLDATCVADSIDFVFAQLHHPHKSELWTPGESNYTGEVISKLEQFTTGCGKPSIHFFGHTHGYSRGQSRDHKHLWINVASAGGAIDNWGEFPNFDYDEFSVSQDEYGFVAVEVIAGDHPEITIKRITRGDQDVIIDNTVTDSLVLKRETTTVNTPVPLFPVDQTIAPECVVLSAAAFEAENTSAQHGQSHWQVSTLADDFAAPVAEQWKNFENWYNEENTQLGDDLTDDEIRGLSPTSIYWWRVRYRDQELNWSAWSEPVSFMTGPSIALPNQLLNPGAESDLEHWTIVEGVVEALTDGVCNGISPYSGQQYFAVGGLCEHSAVARCIQDVDVSAYADSVSTGVFKVNFGGYLANFGGSDLPEMRLIFLDQSGTELGVSNTLSNQNPVWALQSATMPIPINTQKIRVELKGTRNAGTDNDAYFDDLFLSLGSMDEDCAILSVTTNAPVSFPNLIVAPNPVIAQGLIVLPTADYQHVKLYMASMSGTKVTCPITYTAGQIAFDASHLSSGTYVFWVKDGRRIIGTGKFMLN